MAWLNVAKTDQVPIGGMLRVAIDDQDIALYHAADGWYATSDICTHAGESLTCGEFCDEIIACPKHGGKFNVRTGAAVAFPCVTPVETFAVEVRDEAVWIDFD